MKKASKSIIIKTLLGVLLILYFSFLYMDFFKIESSISSDKLKFLSIILVFIISLIIGENSISSRDVFLLRLGLFTTLIADFFLLFKTNKHILGVGLFCLVQILYNLRYRGKCDKNIIYKFMVLFVLLFLVYSGINKFIREIDFLIMISIYYAICLLSSTYRGVKLFKSHKFPKLNSKMIVWGMILFLLCDINVAVFNLFQTINISSSVLLFFKNLSAVSMWLFYLPAQILLALSGYVKKYKIT